MKKTKIICTIGPSSSDKETIKKMMKAGMNVARLNFSHGTHEEHAEIIKRLKAARKELNMPLAIMLDTKGPEYRIGMFKDGHAFLKDGDRFVFTSKNVLGDQNCVSVSYKGMISQLEIGDIILVNDGLVRFRVEEKNACELICKTLIGGKLSNKKSMCFPGKVFNQVYLSAQDKSDLLFGIEQDIDFVACSFVSNASDIKSIRSFLDKNGGEDIELIAKIENRSGVENAEAILKYCEGLMVARGDLGTELPYIELPAIQKQLISLCRKEGGISVVATEMLESMTSNPRPTRAEISDVANSVYDGASAIMLSGETAAGKYPVEAVKTMSSIAEETEKQINYSNRFRQQKYDFANLTDSLSHAACQLALDSKAKCIVASTTSGQTARMISRFRVDVPIIGLTPDEKSYRQLALSWNVYPIMTQRVKSSDAVFEKGKRIAKLHKFAKSGDVVVVTGGMTNRAGSTSLIHADII